jgi:hypothetical protein
MPEFCVLLREAYGNGETSKVPAEPIATAGRRPPEASGGRRAEARFGSAGASPSRLRQLLIRRSLQPSLTLRVTFETTRAQYNAVLYNAVLYNAVLIAGWAMRGNARPVPAPGKPEQHPEAGEGYQRVANLRLFGTCCSRVSALAHEVAGLDCMPIIILLLKSLAIALMPGWLRGLRRLFQNGHCLNHHVAM